MAALRSLRDPVLHPGLDRQYDSDLHHAANETLKLDAHPGVCGADGLFADHGFGAPLVVGPDRIEARVVMTSGALVLAFGLFLAGASHSFLLILLPIS